MAGRAARIVAVVLLTIASVEILEGDRHTPLRLAAAECEFTAAGGLWESDDNCFSCAACEEANVPPRLFAPATATHRAPTLADHPQSGIRPAPYHPPR